METTNEFTTAGAASELNDGLGCTAQVGDRVAVLHRGIPTGRYGIVLAARTGCLEVRGDGDSDDCFPMWDSADCFRVMQPNAKVSGAGTASAGLPG